MNPERLRSEILRLTREYSRSVHGANRPGDDPLREPWSPGQSTPYAGRVFTEDEVEAAVASVLEFWLTLGPEGGAFEEELASFLGVKHSLLVNSGSSANLIALSALTSSKLPDHRRIKQGDEVITVNAGFPTTVAPILQVGAVPVFIDANPLTGNADCSMLGAAYSPGKSKAVIMAHALGNPFDLGAVLAFCKKHDLWLIEDNCDALGCTYSMPVEMARDLGLDHLLKIAESGSHPIVRIQPSASYSQLLTAPTGAWGDLSTQSFYPPHHLTMGEGGAVNIIRRPQLKSLCESFRDWGRDCWCASGKDDTCGKRFDWQLGELPQGYDHKYIYSHLGYNLKPLDIQAAIGRQQLKKLPSFIEARKRNWEILRFGLSDLDELFDFTLPTHASQWIPPRVNLPLPSSSFSWDTSECRTACSWFGFMLLIKPDAPFTRASLAKYLDQHRIGNRPLFGGNLVRQPAFVQLARHNPHGFRVVGRGTGADMIMNNAIFLGVYPGLSSGQLQFEIETLHRFVAERSEIARR